MNTINVSARRPVSESAVRILEMPASTDRSVRQPRCGIFTPNVVCWFEVINGAFWIAAGLSLTSDSLNDGSPAVEMPAHRGSPAYACSGVVGLCGAKYA